MSDVKFSGVLDAAKKLLEKTSHTFLRGENASRGRVSKNSVLEFFTKCLCYQVVFLKNEKSFLKNILSISLELRSDGEYLVRKYTPHLWLVLELI